MLLHHHMFVQDDVPLEPCAPFCWRIEMSGYGVAEQRTRPQTDGRLGAYHIEPALKDFPRDLEKLRPQTFSVDRPTTLAYRAALEEVYDGLLAVRPRGNPWWTLGLTMPAVFLVGLEGLMVHMSEEPEALQQLMSFLRDDRLRLVEWLEREGLLTLNNENDYVGSGSFGYSRDLPQPDLPAGHAPRATDLWTLLESQETVGVGPRRYEEFVFPHEAEIARRFGRVYYGCCEPVHSRWAVLQKMPNLRRVSVSPWCDQEFMAAALGKRRVFSRKPNPALVSTEWFDEKVIRDDLRQTLRLTRAQGCTVEIILKDVHTLNGEPDRLARWVRLARECVAEA